MFKSEHKPDYIVDQAPIIEEIVSKTAATTLGLTAYETHIVTGDTDGNEAITLPSGQWVGQRKFVKLKTRTGTDTLVFNHALIETAAGAAATGCTMDAANEWACFEWTGVKWRAIYVGGTTITTA
jgi:hypothetical protein